MFLFIGYYNLNKKDDKDDVEPKKKRYVSNATRLFAKQIPHSIDTCRMQSTSHKDRHYVQ